jgi:hypothetical protein
MVVEEVPRSREEAEVGEGPIRVAEEVVLPW